MPEEPIKRLFLLLNKFEYYNNEEIAPHFPNYSSDIKGNVKWMRKVAKRYLGPQDLSLRNLFGNLPKSDVAKTLDKYLHQHGWCLSNAPFSLQLLFLSCLHIVINMLKRALNNKEEKTYHLGPTYWK